MFKRRRDYEIYCRHRADWQQAWQIFGNVYSIYVLWHPEFIKCIWCDFRGMRWRALKSYLKRPYYSHGKARAEADVWEDEMYCRGVIDKFKNYMAEQMGS